jgi:hypothetical protein
MNLACTSTTSGKQYPDLKYIQHSNAVHKAFGIKVENQKPDSLNSSSIQVLDEEKSRGKKQALLDLVKWAQEQQWKGNPDLSTNHDAYFLKAAKEDLEVDDEVLEAEGQASE